MTTEQKRELLLQQALAALKRRDRLEAKGLLTQALRLDSNHAATWFLLSYTIDDPEQRRESLLRALRIDPAHPQARKAIIALDQQFPPSSTAPPIPPLPASPFPAARPGQPAPPDPAAAPRPVERPRHDPSDPGGGQTLSVGSPTGSAPPPARPQPALLPPVTPPPITGEGAERSSPSGVRLMAAALTPILPLLLGGACLLLLVIGGGWLWMQVGNFSTPSSGARVRERHPLVRPDWLIAAEELRWTNRFDEAEEALRKAAREEEEEAIALAALSLLLSDRMGQADEAVRRAERAVEVAESPAEKAYAAYALVTALEAQQYPPNASAMREATNVAFKVAPGNVYTQMARARAMAANADWSTSMAAARTAAYDPAAAEAAESWISLARATREQGEFKVAEEAYGKALEIEDYAPWQLERALLLAQQQRFDEATIILAHGRSLAPDLPAGPLVAAQIALLKGDWPAAEAAIAELEGLLPERGFAPLLRGTLAAHQGNWSAARDAFALAQRDGAVAVLARALRSQSYSASGDCQRGAEEARALQKEAPGAPEAVIALGYAFLCAGDTDNALPVIRRAIQRNPAVPELHQVAAKIATAEGLTEQAIDHFVSAIRYAPTLTGIHPALSDLYLTNGDPLGGLRARFHAEIALELDQNDATAHAAMARLLHAMRRPQQASEHFRQAIEQGPGTPHLKLEYAEALLAAGETNRAVELLEPMLQGQERSPLLLYTLARAYRTQGRFTEARDAMGQLMRDYDLPDGIMRFGQALFDSEGYAIQRDYLTAAISLGLNELMEGGDNIHARIRSEGEREWLTLVIPVSDVVQDNELIGTASIGMIVGASYFSRITPAINGGVQVQIQSLDGTPRFTTRVPAAIAREYSDGLLDEWYLMSSMQFVREQSADQQVDAERAGRIGLDLAEHRRLTLLEEVPFNTISQEELAERFAEDSSDARTQQAIRAAEMLYQMLGLVSQEESMEEVQEGASVENVAGFYEPEEGAFYLVTGTGWNDPIQDEITVAHEYQHALQDQHWGLAPFYDFSNGDQRLAFQALMEGEATYTSFSYAYGKLPLYDILGAFSSAAQVDEERLEASPRHVRSTILFPYETGYAFVRALVENEEGETDWDKLNELLDSPPKSTEQVLHPEKYSVGEAPKQVSLPDLAPLGEGWTVEHEDVLGELLLNLAIEPFTGHAIASRISDGWGGDRYAVLRGPNGEQAMVLRIVWDSTEEATEFWDLWPLYLRHRPTFRRLIDNPMRAASTVTRWWQGPDQVIFVQKEDHETTTIAIGPDRALLEPLADSLPGAIWENSQELP